MNKQISINGIKLIKSFEGCRLKAYRCPAGVLTIGYGHTGSVKDGQSIIQSEADRLLVEDLQKFVNGVGSCVKVEITQNQFDALVSFAYNCGLGALKTSSLLKYVNKKQFDLASKEFLRWNKAGGKVLAGLTRRRQAELKLFLSK
jgi:lysozyme